MRSRNLERGGVGVSGVLALLRAAPTLAGGSGLRDPARDHVRRLEDDAARARLRAEDDLRVAARAVRAAARPPERQALQLPTPSSPTDRPPPATPEDQAERPTPPGARAWETRSPAAPQLGPTPPWRGSPDSPALALPAIPRGSTAPPRTAAPPRACSIDDDPPGPRRLGFDRLLAEFAAGPQRQWVESNRQRPRPTARALRNPGAGDRSGRTKRPRPSGRGARPIDTARRRRGRRRTTVGGIVLLVATALAARSAIPLARAPVLQSRLVASSTTGTASSSTAYARREIPPRYMTLYLRAAAEYQLDWATLAAVGQVESREGQSVFPGVRSGTNAAGAAGPAQFVSATWDRYGVDGDGDGEIDPYDPADAIPSMAAFLRASGAPENWPKALFAYNHSQSYVNAVLAMSQRFDPQPGLGMSGDGQ